MVEQGRSETDWDALRAISDAEVEAAAAGDPDTAEWEIDWSKAVLQPDTRKTAITIRLDPDILAFFRAQGRGYQTKINAVLRAYMDHVQR
ncbi:BrnA antitoxin family protein [Methylobacterium sp. J-030]|uniref:BrnA antitoxin family protein n=1 Tax=Methylobacterium sp. J-030 TaxID=2836627 RepID=UPI001FB88130|nr:BrnA antitoxin family protein [Methylobacterium sp. J-030]MCJ2073548.1 BrnA antitoxin family protein [Methylobacterium sp. J-030]